MINRCSCRPDIQFQFVMINSVWHSLFSSFRTFVCWFVLDLYWHNTGGIYWSLLRQTDTFLCSFTFRTTVDTCLAWLTVAVYSVCVYIYIHHQTHQGSACLHALEGYMEERGCCIMSYLLGVVNPLSWGEMSAITQQWVWEAGGCFRCEQRYFVIQKWAHNKQEKLPTLTCFCLSHLCGLKLPLVPVLLLLPVLLHLVFGNTAPMWLRGKLPVVL